MTDKLRDAAQDAIDRWDTRWKWGEFMQSMEALRSALDQPALAQRPAVPPEWLEQAFREGWASCRDSEFIGQEAEDWAFGNSFADLASNATDTLHRAPGQPKKLRQNLRPKRESI